MFDGIDQAQRAPIREEEQAEDDEDDPPARHEHGGQRALFHHARKTRQDKRKQEGADECTEQLAVFAQAAEESVRNAFDVHLHGEQHQRHHDNGCADQRAAGVEDDVLYAPNGFYGGDPSLKGSLHRRCQVGARRDEEHDARHPRSCAVSRVVPVRLAPRPVRVEPQPCELPCPCPVHPGPQHRRVYPLRHRSAVACGAQASGSTDFRRKPPGEKLPARSSCSRRVRTF